MTLKPAPLTKRPTFESASIGGGNPGTDGKPCRASRQADEAAPRTPREILRSSLNFAATQPRHPCAGLFFVRLVLIYRYSPTQMSLSINATKDGVFFRHCRRTGEICYDFR